MNYSRDELSTFSLQKLASLYPQDLQEETLLREIFGQRASVSSYFALTSLVDIKNGWQEEIIQKYVDEKRETMVPENAAVLSPEDEAQLDAAVITKEKEIALQEKLDTENSKRKASAKGSKEEAVEESLDTPAAPEQDTETLEEEPVSIKADEAPKKRGRPAKN